MKAYTPNIMICELVEGREFNYDWITVYMGPDKYDIILSYGIYHIWTPQLETKRFRIPKTIAERYRTLKAFLCNENCISANYTCICPLHTNYPEQSQCPFPCEECIHQFAQDVKHVYFASWAAQEILGADVGSLITAQIVS